MIIRTFTTTDSQEHVVQVGCLVMNDAWEALTESYVDVGPFDRADVLADELRRRLVAHGRLMMANAPSNRDPGDPPPLLPFG